MLVGYVSDELDSALSDVAVEIAGPELAEPIATRSRASGAVYADVPEGRFGVTLGHPGYGAKRSDITLVDGQPHRFRLLADRLLGYAWPKWVRSGEFAEFRVHSPEPYKLDLYR